MKMVIYLFLLLVQATGAVAYVRVAQGHRSVLLEAKGAMRISRSRGLLQASGCAVAAALMVIGLVTQRWIGWDVGVIVMVTFFYLELRRLRAWKGFSKTFTMWVLCPIVLLFSLIDLLTHV